MCEVGAHLDESTEVGPFTRLTAWRPGSRRGKAGKQGRRLTGGKAVTTGEFDAPTVW